MENSRDATEAILHQRHLALLLFRRAFAEEPDAAFMESMASATAIEAIEVFAAADPRLAAMASTMRELPQASEAARFLDEARAEYTALFIGPAKAIAPFWESVYLDPRELLFLESTADVRNRYEAEGYRVGTTTREAEDSIAFELDFMACLAERTIAAFRDGDGQEFARLVRVQQAFEQDHMLDWLPQFAERAKGVPSACLYPMLCAAVAAFVAVDTHILEEFAEEAA